MTSEEQSKLITVITDNYEIALRDADSPLEERMLKMEYEDRIQRVKNGENPLKTQKPYDSDYECVGCGA